MYCIVINGTKEFIEAANTELENKGLNKFIDGVFIANSVSNFDAIARGLKNLESYKKHQSKNIIYKTTNLSKL